jgi:TolB-like protein
MLATLAGLLLAAGNMKVAVVPLRATDGVEERTALAVTDAVTAELRTVPKISAVSTREVEAVLDFQRKQDLLGCSDTACFAEIGGALGVDAILAGSLSRLGESWLVHLNLVDIGNASVLAQTSRRLKGGTVDDVLDTLPDLVAELMTAVAPYARLSVDTDPPDLLVTLDGKPIGKAPIRGRKLAPGRWEIASDGPCHRGTSRMVAVGAGQHGQEVLRLEPRTVDVRVDSADSLGEVVQAKLEVEGNRKLTAPGMVALPICAGSLRARTADGRQVSVELALREAPGQSVTLVFPPSAASVAAADRRSAWLRRLP